MNELFTDIHGDEPAKHNPEEMLLIVLHVKTVSSTPWKTILVVTPTHEQ